VRLSARETTREKQARYIQEKSAESRSDDAPARHFHYISAGVLVTRETKVGEARKYRREVGYDYSGRVVINRGMLE